MKKNNVIGYSNNAMAFSMKGLPDVIVHYKGGRSAFAEIKESGDRLSGVQKERIRQLRALGFYVEVVRSIDDVKKFVYNVAKGVKNAEDDERIS
jgi:hypothetical protein